MNILLGLMVCSLLIIKYMNHDNLIKLIRKSSLKLMSTYQQEDFYNTLSLLLNLHTFPSASRSGSPLMGHMPCKVSYVDKIFELFLFHKHHLVTPFFQYFLLINTYIYSILYRRSFIKDLHHPTIVILMLKNILSGKRVMEESFVFQAFRSALHHMIAMRKRVGALTLKLA